MNITFTVIIILAIAYFMFMFVLSMIFVPHLGWKRKLDEKLSPYVQRKVDLIKKKSKSKKELLENIIKFQLSHFKSSLNMVFSDFGGLFDSSTKHIWKNRKFLHCHQQNLILRQLLLATGKFSEKDIKRGISACYLNIHQHSRINIGSKKNPEWIKADPFAMSMGYKLGEVLGFLCYTDMKNKNIDWRPNLKEYKNWKKNN